MFTLFTVMSLDRWASHVARPIIDSDEVGPASLIFFLVFLLTTTYGLMNIVVGTIVQNTVDIANDREGQAAALIELEQKKLILELRDFFEACDSNDNGLLEKE